MEKQNSHECMFIKDKEYDPLCLNRRIFFYGSLSIVVVKIKFQEMYREDIAEDITFQKNDTLTACIVEIIYLLF